MQHVSNPWSWTRRPTRRVAIGSVGVGGNEPIRVQSMTTPLTWDVDATVAQIEALARAGCEIARVTVPTQRDVDALPRIREQMRQRHLEIPLVADIHFSPKAALGSVEHVEKVRINPGNYTDSKRFEQQEYSDAEYAAELARIEERFAPLVERCQAHGVAMRIGTNHGSLSDRIMNRFGDTPLGMVESALEFVRICRRLDYHDLVLSMKASNVGVMVAAYRLLAARMDAEGMDYPFHLGVTEAGDGVDGRLKSAAGMGALLEDGIGDTVRVSLTEDPVNEVPVGFELVRRYNQRIEAAYRDDTPAPALDLPFDPFDRQRRVTRPISCGPIGLGGSQPLAVEADFGPAPRPDEVEPLARRLLELASGVGGRTTRRLEIASWEVRDANGLAAMATLRSALETTQPSPAVALREPTPGALLEADLIGQAARAAHRLAAAPTPAAGADARREQAVAIAKELKAASCAWLAEVTQLPEEAAGAAIERVVEMLEAARTVGLEDVAVSLVPADDQAPSTHLIRRLVATLDRAGHSPPVLLRDRSAVATGILDVTETGLRLGSLLVDGLGDAVRVEGLDPVAAISLAYDALQAVRLRSTKTDFISCPSCGRTLFDLESTTARIKERTAHLSGVKIAVMGCLVNGLGEMADADFGYVGWKPGLVNLFVGRDCVEPNVPAAAAADRLVELIKREGRWQEPPAAEEELSPSSTARTAG